MTPLSQQVHDEMERRRAVALAEMLKDPDFKARWERLKVKPSRDVGAGETPDGEVAPHPQTGVRDSQSATAPTPTDEETP